MDIKALAQDAAPYVVERRHYYHQHPELTGEEKNTRDAIHRDLEALGADAVGVNCSCGPDQLVSVVRNLRDAVSLPIIAKPNAGMPVIDEKTGQAVYPMGPEAFARSMRALMEAGATVVGGCCGTTPEHIAALRQVKEEVLG